MHARSLMAVTIQDDIREYRKERNGDTGVLRSTSSYESKISYTQTSGAHAFTLTMN